VCDEPETCTGGSANCPPEGYAGAGAVCRSASGACDVAEACTGGGPACPSDAIVPSGTTCRPAAGECDVPETCDGASSACPVDGFAPATTVCRSSAGACDVAETCSGHGPACSSDRVVDAGVVCRTAAGACDVAETCDGTNSACPGDAPAPDGAPCDDGNVCTPTDACRDGACIGTGGPSCSPCEVCDGAQGCIVPEDAGCLAASPRRSSLTMRAVPGDPSRTRLAWKWGGPAIAGSDLGDPLATTGFTICLIDETSGGPTLRASADAPAGGACGRSPCWKVRPMDARYRDRDGTPDGITSLSLKASAAGKIKAKAAGERFPLASLGFTSPVTVRVHRSDAPVCWEARYAAPSTNTGLRFRARND